MTKLNLHKFKFNINLSNAGTIGQCPEEIDTAEYILPSVVTAGESIKFAICHRVNYFILASLVSVNGNNIDLYLTRHFCVGWCGETPVFNESLFVLDQGLEIGNYNINLFESVVTDVVGGGGPFSGSKSSACYCCN